MEIVINRVIALLLISIAITAAIAAAMLVDTLLAPAPAAPSGGNSVSASADPCYDVVREVLYTIEFVDPRC